MTKYILVLICLIACFSFSCQKIRGSKMVVGISVADINSPEIIQIKRGIESTPDSIKNKCEIIWVSADNSIEKQTEQVKQLVNEKGIDVLILNCVSDLRSEPFLRIIEDENIPVVSVLNIPISTQVYGYVTPNYNFLGKFQSQYVADKLEGRGKVMILSGNSFSDMYATISGRNRVAFEKFHDITVVCQKYINNNSEIKPIIDSMLKTYDNNIRAIISHTDEIALEAIKVLKEKKLDSKVLTVGAGCSLEGVRSILNNDLDMSVDLGLDEVGQLALYAAVDLLNLSPLNDKGLKYKNGDSKVSWILSTVRAYDKSNIGVVIDKYKYPKESNGLLSK